MASVKVTGSVARGFEVRLPSGFTTADANNLNQALNDAEEAARISRLQGQIYAFRARGNLTADLQLTGRWPDDVERVVTDWLNQQMNSNR